MSSPDDQPQILSREEIEDIAERAATRAFEKLCAQLGWDISTNDAMIKVQADNRYTRWLRENSESWVGKFIGWVLGGVALLATAAVIATQGWTRH